MKKKIKLVLLLITIALFSFVNFSSSKYVFDVDDDVDITTGAFYFETNANDVSLSASNMSFTIEIDNYLGSLYTDGDIEYRISISDGIGVHDDYNFTINGGGSSASDYYVRTLTGGQQSSDTLTINLQKMVTNNLISEDIYFTIEALGPYSKTVTFTATVISPSGFEVIGNATSWTRGPVTLTVVPDSNNVTHYSFDDGVTWQTSPSKTYTDNQNDILIRTKDSLGNISDSASIDITFIDNEDPVISFTGDKLYATFDEDTPYTSLVTISDAKSGIDDTGLIVRRNNNIITNTNQFTRPGWYSITLSVSDKVGNETTINTSVMVRWPTGGRYVVKKLDIQEEEGGVGVVGEGHSNYDSDDGLYKDTAATGANVGLPFASKYYYAGANVDNYIDFAGSTFRILNISTNDDLKILGDVSDTKVRWGPSYQSNNRKIYESNTYNTWSTKWWPRGQIYNNETGETKYKLFSETEKNHLDLATFYAGRFNKADAVDISYTVYLEQTSGVNLGGDNDTNPAFEGYSAYPNVSDYLKACRAHDVVSNIDDSQSTALFGLLGKNRRQIFRETSWIDMSVDQWTMNSKNATNTDNDFWVVDTAGGANIQSRTFYYEQQYRVVFYITDTTILSGSGTSGDPYVVQENWDWFDNTQVLQ